ncbi:hypothetical protein A7D00_6639 [Trichophyton violaceum]|uniref:Uncharacterized protein n=1 Tax=Trichophyton violaceum TaxID=34388 RepID=A0A178FAY7_TRIVO|nr:hypothetical protein A7D00_6639 [Trichophyton violaceum]
MKKEDKEEKGKDKGEEKGEEEKLETTRQMLRSLSMDAQAAELMRLREAAAVERKQLLWKEERILILEGAIATKLRQEGPAESAAAAAQPTLAMEVEEIPEASAEDWVMEGT